MTEVEFIKKQNDEFRQQAVDRLCTGAAKDYAEYRELCGLIRGLETALREVYDLARHQQENDDD